MKHWMAYLGAAVLIIGLGWLPFSGTDVGQLQPLEVLYVSRQDGRICLESDTGDSGWGTTLADAFADLRETAAGEIFLDTADYVLLGSGTENLTEGLWQQLRPGCQICRVLGEPELQETARFLSAHEPGITMLKLRAGAENLPVLLATEGEMRLVQP